MFTAHDVQWLLIFGVFIIAIGVTWPRKKSKGRVKRSDVIKLIDELMDQ